MEQQFVFACFNPLFAFFAILTFTVRLNVIFHFLKKFSSFPYVPLMPTTKVVSGNFERKYFTRESILACSLFVVSLASQCNVNEEFFFFKKKCKSSISLPVYPLAQILPGAGGVIIQNIHHNIYNVCKVVNL